DIGRRKNQLDGFDYTFLSSGCFERSDSPALRKMVVLLEVAEAKLGPFFEIRYFDLRSRNLEGFLEARQVFDFILIEDEGCRRRRAIFANQDADFPEL